MAIVVTIDNGRASGEELVEAADGGLGKLRNADSYSIWIMLNLVKVKPSPPLPGIPDGEKVLEEGEKEGQARDEARLLQAFLARVGAGRDA